MPPGKEPSQKCAQFRRKLVRLRVDQRGDLLRWKHRLTIDQDDMAAYSQGWVRKRQLDRIRRSRPLSP